MRALFQRSQQLLSKLHNRSEPAQDRLLWEYKVVQLFSQTPADATDASKKLGGTLSPEGLRDQFPEHYGVMDGRKQLHDFLNTLGQEGWELIEAEVIMNLPLMIFKRKLQQAKPE